MTTLHAKGSAHPTAHTKRLLAASMFQRGGEFMIAAVLLEARMERKTYVVLHLEAQAIELVLKSLLLAKDHARFKPKLRTISHHIVRAADELTTAIGARQVEGDLRNDLEILSHCYAQTLLRYPTNHDVFLGPEAVNTARVRRRFYALIRLVRQKKVFPSPAALST